MAGAATIARTCTHPDRDCARLMCGRPVPCPLHTTVADERSIVERGTMTPAKVRRILDAREAGAQPDQRSTEEQLRDVMSIINLLGYYDAADHITRALNEPQH